MLRAGHVVGGRFRLIRQIGAGGMASVWWARHELLGRDVALKLSPTGRDEQTVARFVREAKIIGKFHHPNIVGVVDAGVLAEGDLGGYLFLAMELLRGVPFAQRLRPNRPLPAAEVVPILIGVCRGLEVAHAAGVVHRDIKPENIFLAETPDGAIVPKIVDFGISHMAEACDAITIDGQLLGTPAYMSPEQARGERAIDARADLWALGVILVEALTGKQPFDAERHHAVLRQIIEGEPAPLPPTIDPALRAIAARCLQKDPARRPGDAAALRAELEAALQRRPAESVDPVLIVPSAPAPARPWTALGLAAGVTVSAALVAAAAWLGPGASPVEPGAGRDAPEAATSVATLGLRGGVAAAAVRAGAAAAAHAAARSAASASSCAIDGAGADREVAPRRPPPRPWPAARRRSRGITRPGF